MEISIDIFKSFLVIHHTMRITAKTAREMLDVLDDLRQELAQNEKEKYPYAEWERGREKVKRKIQHLPEYVEEAASKIMIESRVGRPKQVDLVKRTMLFLFARLMNKSNRDVEDLLEFFGPLFDIEVSYKYIERLYSDEEVRMVLHNLFILLLQDESVSGSISGDGSGYSLLVTDHYRTDPKKKGKKYRYVFRLMDVTTGMYVALGYSGISEMDAFNRAMRMLRELGIDINTITLDKYFSSRKVLRLFGKDTAVYLIPKKNIANLGPEWTRLIARMIESPINYLKKYFMRNLNESGFSADKRRFGWTVRQRREDRRETAMFSIGLLHNIFTVRVIT